MIVIANAQHGALIAAAAGTQYDPRHDTCVSRVTRDGELLGGVIYTRFNGAAVWCHVAGEPGWMSPELVWIMFDYPFMQLQVNQILCSVASGNELSINLVKRLGGKQLYSIKNAAPHGQSLVLFSMSKANCKWLTLRSRYMKANGHAKEFVHAHV